MKRNLHAGLTMSGGFRLKMFSDEEFREIHLATLDVLGRTGVYVGDDEAMEIFHGAGAQVDKATRMVKLPGYLVEECIKSAPSRFVCYGRHPKHDVVLEANRVGFTNFGEGIKILDLWDGAYRDTSKKDCADAAKLCDYLDEIDVFERPINASEVPQYAGPLHIAEACIPNTTKHVFQGPNNGRILKFLIEMMSAAVGGRDKFDARPCYTPVTCPNSPLRLVGEVCEIIMTAAREGVGVNILSMALSGGSSPVTLAGTLVTHNAEVLSGICLAQLTRKGTPVIYASSTTCMDLRLASAPVGAPELGMVSAAVAGLAQYYQLPSWVAGA